MFAEGSKPFNPNADDDIACAHVAIAETPSRSAVKQSLKEETINRLVLACEVGKAYQVAGSILNLSHDVFVFVKIDSIAAR